MQMVQRLMTVVHVAATAYQLFLTGSLTGQFAMVIPLPMSPRR